MCSSWLIGTAHPASAQRLKLTEGPLSVVRSLPSPLDKVDKIYASMRQEIRRDGCLTWDVLCALCLRLMEPGGARAGGGTADDDGESPTIDATPQLIDVMWNR